MKTRREFLGAGAGALGALLLGCGSRAKNTTPDASRPLTPSPTPTVRAPAGGGYIVGYEPERATEMAPAREATPECAETEDNIEGPFYKAGAPERGVLAGAQTKGTRLVLTGRVLGTSAACGALAGAEIDLWQADAAGVYDLAGFGMRGKVKADAQGNYRFETVIPGRYLNGPQYRPAHLHVKVRSAGKLVLTTQLYFAGDPYNDIDPFIKKSLIMKLDDNGAAKVAGYDLTVAG
jgi:protocatechuate 3,4-dioxygenase beta subunit